MDKRRLKELLAEHADRLLEGVAGRPDCSPEDEAELAALLNVAERVKSTLTPIEPAFTFEDELKRELLTTAHLRKAEGYVPPNPERDLMILAGLLGFIAIFVSVMLMWRVKERPI